MYSSAKVPVLELERSLNESSIPTVTVNDKILDEGGCGSFRGKKACECAGKLSASQYRLKVDSQPITRSGLKGCSWSKNLSAAGFLSCDACVLTLLVDHAGVHYFVIGKDGLRTAGVKNLIFHRSSRRSERRGTKTASFDSTMRQISFARAARDSVQFVMPLWPRLGKTRRVRITYRSFANFPFFLLIS